MPIEFKCSGCGNTLRVPDEHAGQPAKCPVCEQVSTIPNYTQPVDDFVSANEVREAPADGVNPFLPPNVDSAGVPPMGLGNAQQMLRPHRGGMILTLGILSVICCNLLGIAPWIMANEDLSLMDRGAMDPSGRGLTTAGRVLGIIALIIMAIGIFIQVVLLLGQMA